MNIAGPSNLIRQRIQRLFARSADDSLKRKSMRAAFWSMTGKFGGDALRLGGSLILTRLLFPEAFGLMATATVVLVMLQLFTDAGIHLAVVQNPRGEEPEFLNSAWMVAIFRGLFVSALVLALAWPMSRFYNEPRLLNIFLILGVIPTFGGLENPGMALLIKRFKVERQVAFELGTQLLGLLVTAVLAFVFRSVYALACGNVVGAILRVVLSYVVQSYRPKFRWEREAGRALLRFGSAIFLNTMITWVAMKADLLIVGRMLGMDAAGFYNLGERFGIMVPSLCTAIFARAYMPAISSVQNDPARVHRIYRRTVALVLALVLPACMMLCLFAPTLIELLYDPRYMPAAEAVRWLNLGSCVRIIGLAAGTTFVALNRVRIETLAMAVGAVGILVFIPFGAQFDRTAGGSSLLGVSIAVAIATALIPVVESFYLHHSQRFPLWVVMRPWIQSLSCMALTAGVYFLLKPWLERPGAWNLIFLAVVGGLSLAMSAVIYLVLEGRTPFSDQLGAKQPAG